MNEPLINRDVDIFGLALSFPNLFLVIYKTQTNANNDQDYLHLWELNLAQSSIPQTFNFIELVHWCATNYQDNEGKVMSTNGHRVICTIS